MPRFAEVKEPFADRAAFVGLGADMLSPAWLAAPLGLTGRHFTHKWMLAAALAARSEAWRLRPAGVANKRYNRTLQRKLEALLTARSRPGEGGPAVAMPAAALIDRYPLPNAPWHTRANLVAFRSVERLFNLLDAGF